MESGRHQREKTLGGKYSIGKLIGNGGMGAVYSGSHLALDRPVAIKVLHNELTAEPVAQARFLREAQAAAMIEHENAIRVYDCGTLDGGGAYLVMEFVDGVTLRELLVERGRLPIESAVELTRQAASALDAAHAQGVVHRDVKPENMMISTGIDGELRLKVVDFGIAKLLTTDNSTQLTRPAELIGTPRYMAPELFSDDEVDGRVDVYALATVLFEMIAGRTPFEGTYGEVIGKHMFAEPPSLDSLGISVPAEVEAVIRRALAKEPADRPATPGEFAELLAEAGRPTSQQVSGELETRVAGAAGERVESATQAPEEPALPRPRRIEIPLGRLLLERASAAGEAAAAGARPRNYALALIAAALVAFLLFVPAMLEPERRAVAAPQALPARAVLTVDAAPEEAPAVADDRAAEGPSGEASAGRRDGEPRDAAPRASAGRPGRAEAAPRRARARRENPLAPVGRALRVDRHLRKLF